jgi:tripartite-type tricarboxylate transporter receptor subunit TctC
VQHPERCGPHRARQGFDRQAWNGWFVRKGTPQAMIDRPAEVSNRTWDKPEWATMRDQFRIEWKVMTPAQTGQQVMCETAAWAEVVKRSGCVPE